jgi:DNA-binding transcriptional MerR regulator
MVTPQDTRAENPSQRGAGSEKKAEPARKDTPQMLAPEGAQRGLLTREESARLLGIAPQTVKAYEKRGLLNPVQGKRPDSNGHDRIVTFYDPQELLKLRAKLQTRTKSGEDGGVDTSTWLTRNEACEMLSISIQTLKNYEERKKLHPLKACRTDARGHEHMVVVYEPSELSKLPRGNGRPLSPRDAGELEAQCYALIERGLSNREIVIALRATSDRVRDLRERWQNDGGTDLMITSEAKDALESLLGPFSDVTDLIALVAAIAKVPPQT